MKILFMANIPSPYRVDFFNELGKFCELTVLFEKNKSDERNESWQKYSFENFRGIILKGISVRKDMAISLEILSFLKNNVYDKVICANMTTPTGMLAIWYMKKKRIKYYLETDGGMPGAGKGFKEKIKEYLIKGAEGYFSTCNTNDLYYLKYGAPKNKIYRYPFTSLSDKDIIMANKSLKNPRSYYKDKLGIVEKKMLLSVGRFSYNAGYGKGYDILLKVSELLDENIGIYIVGDLPTEEFLKIREKKNLKNVHFVGFKEKKELSNYFLASDMFILLSRGDVWGLVINEAMMYGLPIISSKYVCSSLEMIEQEKNGWLVDLNKIEEIANIINISIYNEEKLDKIKENNIEKSNEYTIEKMVKRHIEILK